MIFLKTLFSVVLFVLLYLKPINCKNAKKSPVISTQASSFDKGVVESNTRSIIKNPKKRRNPIGSKHVKFADQVLDDSIGFEPLDPKEKEIKSKSVGGERLKKTASEPTGNDGAHLTYTLSLIFLCAVLTLCF
jgi:hypothetical protein